MLAALVTALRVELAMAIMLQVPAEGLGGRELRHRRDGDAVEFRFNVQRVTRSAWPRDR